MLERGGGSLIFTSSLRRLHGRHAGNGRLCREPRRGLIGLTQVLAAEYGPKGLRVNALLPGGTDTPGGHLQDAGRAGLRRRLACAETHRAAGRNRLGRRSTLPLKRRASPPARRCSPTGAYRSTAPREVVGRLVPTRNRAAQAGQSKLPFAACSCSAGRSSICRAAADTSRS